MDWDSPRMEASCGWQIPRTEFPAGRPTICRTSPGRAATPLQRPRTLWILSRWVPGWDGPKICRSWTAVRDCRTDSSLTKKAIFGRPFRTGLRSLILSNKRWFVRSCWEPTHRILPLEKMDKFGSPDWRVFGRSNDASHLLQWKVGPTTVSSSTME